MNGLKGMLQSQLLYQLLDERWHKMAMQLHSTKLSSGFTCQIHGPCKKVNTSLKLQADHFTRRRIATAIALASSVFSDSKIAFSFQFSITVPDQTINEAEAGIKNRAQELLSIKTLIDSETWKAAQITLRESSSRLKQDLYTIIQAKPGNQRPELRKLYCNLFNNVTEVSTNRCIL
ncbi:PsbQ-like protein 3, chloroplastic [Dendrobium catenatum]|uniref:PsbQ-like protein 3, chloroplastic n=1 Tax=Dendrobium catenatum TaxID=906689 RepID=A0A2I0XJR7_9ASPA|nr:PsbQ-like protein 3, chloroplastic [Dendrobium catenatum]